MKSRQHEQTGGDEAGAPTPERARIANGSLQKIDLYDKNSRVPIATAYRVNSVLDKLFANGQIDDAMHRAGEMFRQDYTYGMLRSMTSKYGLDFEMAAAIGPTSGTPVSQQKQSDNRRDREECANNFISAYRYINHKATADALVAVICEESATLAEIGAAWTGYGSSKQQSAAGFAQFKIGLDKLSENYGTKSGRR
jgi:hypothetical protein